MPKSSKGTSFGSNRSNGRTSGLAPSSSPRSKSRTSKTGQKPSFGQRVRDALTPGRSLESPMTTQRAKGGLDQTAPVKKAAAPPIKRTTANPGQPKPGPKLPPRAPNTPPRGPTTKLPADSVTPDRGSKRPDRTLLDAMNQPTANRSAQKYRGSVLASVYKLPVDPAKSARTMQQFNGPRGVRTTLG